MPHWHNERKFGRDRRRSSAHPSVGDDTLQPGDIVSTDKGLFLFRGRSGPDGQTADFVPMKREVAQRLFKRCATSNRLVLLM